MNPWNAHLFGGRIVGTTEMCRAQLELPRHRSEPDLEVRDMHDDSAICATPNEGMD